MSKLIDKRRKISIWCEFDEPKLENEFMQNEMGRTIRQTRPIALALGILYLIFLVPDFFLISKRTHFLLAAGIRIFFFAVLMAFIFSIRRLKSEKSLSRWINLIEGIGVVCYLFILLEYKNMDVLFSIMGMMLLTIGIFLVPSKWMHSVLTAGGSIAIFCVFSTLHLKGTVVPGSDVKLGMLYLAVLFIQGSIFSFRANYLRRTQYYDGKELTRQSSMDALTGIYNRGKFDSDFKYWVDYSKRYQIPLSLVLFDFDEFKKINDMYGHLVGDDVLVQSVNLICGSIRQTDIFARWGGEEFVLLLTNTEKNMAIDITERIRRLIAEYSFETVGKVTCSFGIVAMEAGDHPLSLLKKADQQLYFAKSLGKNQIAS